MESVFKISGYVSFILFIIKVFIHLYLNSKNGYTEKMSFFPLIEFFFFYDKKVETEYGKLKRVCNTIYLTAIACFILSLITILIMNIKK